MKYLCYYVVNVVNRNEIRSTLNKFYISQSVIISSNYILLHFNLLMIKSLLIIIL